MRLYSNNASTFLDAAVAAVDQTTITVSSSTGFPSLPSTPGTDYYHITVEDVNGNYEIMRVIAMSGSGNRVFTVQRAQEGTAARVFSTPGTTRVEVRLTAEAMTEFFQRTGDTINGGSNFGTSTASRSVIQLRRNQTEAAGTVPTGLNFGELAVDIKGYKLFVGDYGGATVELVGKIAVQSTTPSTPSAGQFWYNTDTKALKVYYNSAWQDIAVAASVGQDILLGNPAGTGYSYSLKATTSTAGSMSLAVLNELDDIILGDATSDATYVRGKLVYVYTSVDGSLNMVEGFRLGYTGAATYYWDQYISNYLTGNILTFRGGRSSSAVAFQVRDGAGTLRTVTIGVDGTITQDATPTNNSPTTTVTTRTYVDNRTGSGKLLARARITGATGAFSGVQQGFASSSRTPNGQYVLTLSSGNALSGTGNAIVQVTLLMNSTQMADSNAYTYKVQVSNTTTINVRTYYQTSVLNDCDFAVTVFDMSPSGSY